MKKSIGFLALLCYLPFVHANTSDTLFDLSNDRDAVMHTFAFSIDAQEVVQGLAYITTDAGKSVEKDFAINDMGSGLGVTLEEQQGIKALQLGGKIDSKSGTGKMVITYVANGLEGTYSSCNMNLKRDNGGKWVVLNAYNGKVVTTAKLITYSLGITTIEGICP